MIRVQREDFDIGAEIEALSGDSSGIGAVASFIGIARADASGDGTVAAMTLEHYPAMTERQLAAIEAEACRRWELTASLIVHRYGRLEPGERIVLVVTAAPHRQAALDACAFLIDWLKTRAPFWKREESDAGARWVTARAADDRAAERWRDRS